MNCECGKIVEFGRVELGLTICKSCATRIPASDRMRGRMVYLDKCTPVIEVHSNSSWNDNKKYFTPNGARSAVKNFSKNISR